MAHYPGGCGFESHRRDLQRSAVAQWQSTVTSLVHNLVGHLKHFPTACWSTCRLCDRKIVRVRLPSAPRCCGGTVDTQRFSDETFVGKQITLDCRSGVHAYAGSTPARPPQTNTSTGPALVIRRERLRKDSLCPTTSSSAIHRSDCRCGVHPTTLAREVGASQRPMTRRLCPPFVGSF